MPEQLQSPTEFAMEFVTHINGMIGTMDGCTTLSLNSMPSLSCTFNMLVVAASLLNDILAGLNMVQEQPMSLNGFGDVDNKALFFINGTISSSSMEETMALMSGLYVDLFDDPWSKEETEVDSKKFYRAMELVNRSLLGPIYRNLEGGTCLALKLHTLSGFDVFKGWKQEVCLKHNTKEPSMSDDVAKQFTNDSTDRGSAFSNWLRKYGVESLSLPWDKFLGKGSFHALANLWEQTKLIIRGEQMVGGHKHNWVFAEDGRTLVNVSLWKDPSDII